MINIEYEDIPLVPKYIADRHGIFRNPNEYTLEVWVQGKKHTIITGECYTQCYSVEMLINILCDTLLRPLAEGTPWQRVLLRQILEPWTGGIVWTNNQ